LIVGDTGVVVAPRNPQALADGLEQMAQRLGHEPQLRSAARERIVKFFSIDTFSQNTTKVLVNLL
jgi:glycosyltransferase involved in cell wall biosynthesis